MLPAVLEIRRSPAHTDFPSAVDLFIYISGLVPLKYTESYIYSCMVCTKQHEEKSNLPE